LVKVVVYLELFTGTHEGMKLYLALILFLPLHVLSATDSVLLPPDDPRQSIAYWKIHAISALEDKDVELAG